MKQCFALAGENLLRVWRSKRWALFMLSDALSLKEVQLKLGVQPYVLIHLCEKEVVIPDVVGTKGRGSARLFLRETFSSF